MPLAARVLIGPAQMALTRMPSLAQILGQIHHAGFERGLGNTHDVVMRHDLFGAVIGQGQHRTALGHDLFGALRDGGEGID